MAASQRYVGRNTEQKAEVGFYEDDERVIEIKGIAKAEKKAQRVLNSEFASKIFTDR